MLLVRCLYNKQNNALLLGDMQFLFSCIELNSRREIPYSRAPMCYSPYNILNKISLVNNERINRLWTANGGYKVQYESCYLNSRGSAKVKHKKQNG